MSKKYTSNTSLIILEYIFAIVTVFQCNSIFLYSVQFHISKSIINLLWQLLLVLLIFILYRKNKRLIAISNEVYKFIFVVLFMFSLLLYLYNLIIYKSVNVSYILKILIDPLLLIILFLSFGSNNRLRINHLFTKFENVVLVISLLSLISYVLFLIHVSPNTDILSKWGSLSAVPGYFDVSFLSPKTTFHFIGLNISRNIGVFSEPSMFSYILLISLLIELFIRNNTEHIFNWRVIIVFLTICSTLSTTGIVIAIIAIIYDVLINNSNNIFKLVIVVLFPVIFLILKFVILNKINATSVATLGSSFNIRMDDIRAGLRTWLQQPLLGCGLNNNITIKYNMSLWRFLYNGKAAESAGFTTILAQGGIIMGMCYILPSLLVSKLSNKLLGLAVLSFIPFIFVIAQGFYIYIMLLSYFWVLLFLHNDKNVENNL